MQLPGRLKATTLGDLLGTLHRARMTGVLELIEDRGRIHRVHLAEGFVTAVEYDGAAASLCEILRREGSVDDDTLRRSLLRALSANRLHGEVLVAEFRLSQSIVHAALKQQVLSRLRAIEQLADARVHFRVAVRAPREALSKEPLTARDFLTGRRRARERQPSAESPRSAPNFGSTTEFRRTASGTAWHVLGITPGAATDEIRRAYRKRVRELHPDLHPGASDERRHDLERQFRELVAAYQQLVA